MKRYLCYLSLLGVGVIPDWASAFHPCWSPPPPCYSYSYGPPRTLLPRPILAARSRMQVYGPVAAVSYPVPPAVYVPYAFTQPYAFNETVVRPVPPYVVAPVIDPMVRPARSDVKVEPVKPTSPPVLPPPTVVPDPSAKAPEPEKTGTAPLAKAPQPESKSDEPLALPDLPMSKGLPVENPQTTKPAESLIPEAKPTPAPSPNETEPLIPAPMVPTFPGSLEPKKSNDRDDSLPPLVLPPEAPGGSSGIVPETTSRSSPLSAAFKVQVFTASGTIQAAATRKIGFFNHTNRDIALVIQGKAVTLPGKTYIHAEVPPTFTWRHSDNAGQRTSVPADAAGLDILFRE